MDTIYSLDEISEIMDAICNSSVRNSFARNYINDLVNKNEDNKENYKLFSTGVIKNANDIIIENEITGSTTFFTFPNIFDNETYTNLTLENCYKIRNIMDHVLLHL
jgi:hypothetical protein